MSRLIDGYPDYLVRVDHPQNQILVNASCIADILKAHPEVKTRTLDEDDEGEQWAVFTGKYEVCHNCHGKGSHVNRAIDGNGLSREDFDEDPDFAEAYRSGVYDVPCDVCGGKRVILVPSEEIGQKAVSDVMREHHEMLAIEAAERRMGA